MSYYHVCPNCGSHLDPGERCDCKTSEKPSDHRQADYWARDSLPVPAFCTTIGRRQSMPERHKAKV